MSRLAQVFSRAKTGITAPAVAVEVHLSAGLPGLSIVGLPEAAVRESKDRVRSAIINSGYDFPDGRITVNLAPADLPKEGGRFDLPIALGILSASGQLPASSLENREFLGELALSGSLRPVTGILPASVACGQADRELIVPDQNAPVAAISSGTSVIAAGSLMEVCSCLTGQTHITPSTAPATEQSIQYPDLQDVRGQPQAKRALIVAAAGGHHMIFFGPPGTGKTMLASRMPGILPPLSEQEALEVAAIHSLTSHSQPGTWKQRPFRTPHHSSSSVSLVGGGSNLRPGEITFAHHGVLFLDEMPEFHRQALEILREPLESREVVISRARGQEKYPASFQLIAAMNPCPCGYLGDKRRSCRCSPDQVKRYINKISGPLLDRIDLQVELVSQDTRTILEHESDASTVDSLSLRKKVINARKIQLKRQGVTNAQLSPNEMKKHCHLDRAEQIFITRVCDRLSCSARAVHRILRVSRTLADLESSQTVQQKHLAEALQYRRLESRTPL